ncbi:MAG: DUF4136 domain-containing protein [Ideonella sp.]|nr:DUF4136 domain-containing protein [Ideonella sp.]MCC7456545.1 DUF4136 domain-containing protein [Nitrospira sp.]
MHTTLGTSLHTHRRTLAAGALAVLAAALLGGCASMSTLTSEVASYGEWPATRKPGTYAFDRLPSQQQRPEQTQRLEDNAHAALEAAGFVAASPGTQPDVLVQLGARITRYERSPWDDPLWWHGGFGPWRYRPWMGPYPWVGPNYWRWGGYRDTPQYDREVALLLRDRASGAPLYEARATSGGFSSGGDDLLKAMFRAAMADFPNSSSTPHSVSVPLTP